MGGKDSSDTTVDTNYGYVITADEWYSGPTNIPGARADFGLGNVDLDSGGNIEGMIAIGGDGETGPTIAYKYVTSAGSYLAAFNGRATGGTILYDGDYTVHTFTTTGTFTILHGFTLDLEYYIVAGGGGGGGSYCNSGLGGEVIRAGGGGGGGQVLVPISHYCCRKLSCYCRNRRSWRCINGYPLDQMGGTGNSSKIEFGVSTPESYGGFGGIAQWRWWSWVVLMVLVMGEAIRILYDAGPPASLCMQEEEEMDSFMLVKTQQVHKQVKAVPRHVPSL